MYYMDFTRIALFVAVRVCTCLLSWCLKLLLRKVGWKCDTALLRWLLVVHLLD